MASQRHRPSVSSIPTQPSTSLKPGRLSVKPQLKSPNVPTGRLPPPPQTPNVKKPEGEDLSRIEPDEMFSRFTVAEVRALQARLRTDADSKQEELRLMVGERYRDLLQASSAIVSISETARKVQTSLEDMKDACNTSKDIRALQAGHRKAQSIIAVPGQRGKHAHVPDSQLLTLQSLAAHLKLLLDTPEQLWRLLERKRFLQAAWLYLLARVVYKALTYDEDEAEEQDVVWAKDGIEVSDQFPLIQRQWDTISSFRSQISYRASQSLRDPPSSASSNTVFSSAAETLASILLLDSLPLSETLSLFLNQRTKTLQSLFSSHQKPNESGHSAAISKSRRKNQEIAASLLRSPNPASPRPLTPDLSSASDFKMPLNSPIPAATTEAMEKRMAKRRREKILKQVRQSLKRVVDVFAATLGAVRSMYGDGKSTPQIESLLQIAVSADSAEESPVNTNLLLKTLPSSTVLLRYLPPSIQSYAPFIDTTSASSRLSPAAIASASSKWCDTSLKSLETNLASWLEDIDSVSEVWNVWIGLQAASQAGSLALLTDDERDRLLKVVQGTCVTRVREIRKEKLSEMESGLVREVNRCIKSLRAGGDDVSGELQPSAFYFAPDFLSASASGITTTSITSNSPAECKDVLRQRISGRTPMLNSVLNYLESSANALKEDTACLRVGDDDVASDLIRSHRQEIERFSLRLAQSLRSLLTKECESASEEETRVAIFIGKLAADLADESRFIADLLPASDDYPTFRAEMSAVHDVALDKWRIRSVSTALAKCRIFRVVQPGSRMPSPSSPSGSLSQALLSLSSSVQQLGFVRRSLVKKQVAQQLLLSFAAGLAGELPSSATDILDSQALWDVSFVAKICSLVVGQLAEPRKSSPIEETASEIKVRLAKQMPPKDLAALVAHVTTSVDTHLTRSSLLLGLLLPSPSAPSSGLAPPSATTRPRGGSGFTSSLPPAEQDFQLAIEIAKPSSRFGMLMVGNALLLTHLPRLRKPRPPRVDLKLARNPHTDVVQIIMASRSFATLVDIRSHLAQNPQSGGAATDANPLILYDLKSNLRDGMAWSPNAWKIRLLLNYKKIPYRTVWIPIEEIESTLKPLHFKPCSGLPSGKSTHTVPAIQDPSANGGEPVLLVDSPVIARYLEIKYPSRPVFHEGSDAAQCMFIDWCRKNLLLPLARLVAGPNREIFGGKSQEYYIRTRSAVFGDLDKLGRGEKRAEALEMLKEALTTLDGFLAANVGGDFFMGTKVSYADFVLIASFVWARRIPSGDWDPAHDNVWDVIKTWHEGRWARIMKSLEPYMEQK